MKAVKIVLGSLVVLLLVIFLVLMFWGGHVIQLGVEQIGPRVLGVPVTLESAKFHPLGGRVSLNGLVVGNPEGFKADHLFAMKSLEVDLDVGSLLSDEIVLRRVIIDSPEIVYEVGLRRTNLGTLIDHLESGEEEELEDQPDERVSPEGEVSSGPAVVIKEFVLADAQLQVSATALGGRVVPIRLSTIRLTDVGGEGQSVTQITTQVLKAILGAAGHAVADAGDLLGSGLKTALEAAGGLGGAAAEGATAAAGLVKEGAGAAAESAAEGARSLKGAGTDGTRAVSGAVNKGLRGLRGLMGGGQKSESGSGEKKSSSAPAEAPSTD